jgi:hypothetical protein
MASLASWLAVRVAVIPVSHTGWNCASVVCRLGRRKPSFKKAAGEPNAGDDPDSGCPAPTWGQAPVRLTFQHGDEPKLVFSIRSRVVDVENNAEEPEE